MIVIISLSLMQSQFYHFIVMLSIFEQNKTKKLDRITLARHIHAVKRIFRRKSKLCRQNTKLRHNRIKHIESNTIAQDLCFFSNVKFDVGT